MKAILFLAFACGGAPQGVVAVKSAGKAAQSVSFLERRSQLEGDAAVKVTVAAVGQPGKSVSKRVGRLAQKWCVLFSSYCAAAMVAELVFALASSYLCL